VLRGPVQFNLLNEARDLAAGGWDDPSVSKLWRYHLHYFDDVNADDAEARDAWHRALVARWIAEVPPAAGTGWEPYPTSLRIVNWIKWHLRSGGLTPEALHSVAIQARWLEQRIEWHILGNHLFTNAKALVFAGVLFEGPEADRWRATGEAILARELPEQILGDGGHFERSPMYHALAFEDVLDVINLDRAYPGVLGAATVEQLVKRAPAMCRWLGLLCHPDGEIALFNDAAIGIAPSPRELETYATRLGLPPATSVDQGFSHLKQSGYIRYSAPDLVVLLDVAPLGPDYLPAHGHADTLSFEVSWFGQRCLVNSGTSLYGNSAERLRQRGTAAHNTVTIDEEDSSEVWGGFRVARRASPQGLQVGTAGSSAVVECAHDGYRRLPGAPVHRRRWTFDRHQFTVEDEVTGRPAGAVARFHLHPAVRCVHSPNQELTLCLPSGAEILVTVAWGTCTTEASTWHPEFGVSVASTCLVVHLIEGRSGVTFRWGGLS
jgi:uncharacterized heparinase superfamily protein